MERSEPDVSLTEDHGDDDDPELDEALDPDEPVFEVDIDPEVGGAGDRAARLATHELPRVRAQAVRALGAVGDTEHVATVRERLDDEHPDVRRAAARALERLTTRLDLEPSP